MNWNWKWNWKRNAWRAGLLLGMSGALCCLSLGAGWALFERIPPGVAAVRQNDWSGAIDAHDYGPGLHWSLRGLHRWHWIDQREQLLGFQAEPQRADDRPPLELRTRDDNSVRLEANVRWQLVPESGHLVVRAGLERSLEQRLVAATEDALRAGLGRLSTEEWFEVDRRQAVLEELLPGLRQAAQAFHVQVLDLELYRVALSAELEAKLQERQLATQRSEVERTRIEVDQARSNAQELAAQTDSLIALQEARWKQTKSATESAAKQLASQSQNQAEVENTRALGEFEERFNLEVGQAKHALEQATAARQAQRLEALGGPGGRALLARSAASALHLREVRLDPADPRLPSLFDFGAYVDLFLGKAR